MTYIALQAMTMADGTVRKPGDTVPEASSWSDPAVWVKSGHVAYVRDGDEQKFLSDVKTGKSGFNLSPGSNPDYLTELGRYLRFYGKDTAAPEAPAKAKAAKADAEDLNGAPSRVPAAKSAISALGQADEEEDAPAKASRKRASKGD